jgi:ATP-dependent Clp protease ATP-binding subunit ClpC
MQRAHQEGQRFNHDYIGSQHVLLALLFLQQEALRPLFAGLRLSYPLAEETVAALWPPHDNPIVIMGKLANSYRLRAMLPVCIEEADAAGSSSVEPEHMLLGVCRQAFGLANRVLRRLGVFPSRIAEQIVTRRGGDFLAWFRDRPEVW